MSRWTYRSTAQSPWSAKSAWVLTALGALTLTQTAFADDTVSVARSISVSRPNGPSCYDPCSPYGQPVPRAYQGGAGMGAEGIGGAGADGQQGDVGQQGDAGQQDAGAGDAGQQGNDFNFDQAAGQPDFGTLASSTGAPSSPMSSAPNMIADFFGGVGGRSTVLIDPLTGETADVVITSPGEGNGVGRIKLVENVSPMPRDRVYLNYSYFDNVALTDDGVNVNRYVPGIEKTFLDGMMSFEARIPFASTLDSDQIIGTASSDDELEFGNMTFAWKTLLTVQDNWILSGGVQVTAPTADDTRFGLPSGETAVYIENESIHVMPFLGFLWLPSEDWFVQGLYQIDVDTNGNSVFINDLSGVGPQFAGVAQDTTFMYVDVGIGYWAYRNECARGLTGISPTVELHYNRSLQEQDTVSLGATRVFDAAENFEQLNIVVGSSFWFNNRTSITAGYATPIAGGVDKNFDGELRILLNHFWGAGGPFARSQF